MAATLSKDDVTTRDLIWSKIDRRPTAKRASAVIIENHSYTHNHINPSLHPKQDEIYGLTTAQAFVKF